MDTKQENAKSTISFQIVFQGCKEHEIGQVMERNGTFRQGGQQGSPGRIDI